MRRREKSGGVPRLGGSQLSSVPELAEGPVALRKLRAAGQAGVLASQRRIIMRPLAMGKCLRLKIRNLKSFKI